MSWKNIVKDIATLIPLWLRILVDYDLPVQIARELNKYNNASKGENYNLSTKLQTIDADTNRGAEIGEISKKVREMVERTDIKSPMTNTYSEDFKQMTPKEYEVMFKYTRHLVEQL